MAVVVDGRPRSKSSSALNHIDIPLLKANLSQVVRRFPFILLPSSHHTSHATQAPLGIPTYPNRLESLRKKTETSKGKPPEHSELSSSVVFRVKHQTYGCDDCPVQLVVYQPLFLRAKRLLRRFSTFVTLNCTYSRSRSSWLSFCISKRSSSFRSSSSRPRLRPL